jgi:hypothetical protein
MSVQGQSRRFGDGRIASALPLKGDIHRKFRHVSKVPIRDMTEPSSAGVGMRRSPLSTVVRRIEQHTGSRKTAVDIEYVARNVGGIAGCEESNCGRDVGRLRVSL